MPGPGSGPELSSWSVTSLAGNPVLLAAAALMASSVTVVSRFLVDGFEADVIDRPGGQPVFPGRYGRRLHVRLSGPRCHELVYFVPFLQCFLFLLTFLTLFFGRQGSAISGAQGAGSPRAGETCRPGCRVSRPSRGVLAVCRLGTGHCTWWFTPRASVTALPWPGSWGSGLLPASPRASAETGASRTEDPGPWLPEAALATGRPGRSCARAPQQAGSLPRLRLLCRAHNARLGSVTVSPF